MCGIIPLALATLIYGTWRLTLWSWLEVAGMWLLLLGFLSVVVGSAFLARFIWHQFKAAELRRFATIWRAGLIGFILLLNFPAAAFFTSSAVDIRTRYTLRLWNDSSAEVESFIIIAPGVQEELGPIRPGQHMDRHLHFSHDGSLRFQARQGKQEFAGDLEGYVTNGMGGDCTVRFKSGGKYDVQRRWSG